MRRPEGVEQERISARFRRHHRTQIKKLLSDDDSQQQRDDAGQKPWYGTPARSLSTFVVWLVFGAIHGKSLARIFDSANRKFSITEYPGLYRTNLISTAALAR